MPQTRRYSIEMPDERPMQWRMIEHLDGVTADVVEFAAARGWVQVEGGHVALTEAARQLARDLGKDLGLPGVCGLGPAGRHVDCVELQVSLP
jgi:pyruvate/2-oxoglutarate dehydrogenase complex dihydrolipoamide acyltransferase (E2) component